jgi:hypothetical protein
LIEVMKMKMQISRFESLLGAFQTRMIEFLCMQQNILLCIPELTMESTLERNSSNGKQFGLVFKSCGLAADKQQWKCDDLKDLSKRLRIETASAMVPRRRNNRSIERPSSDRVPQPWFCLQVTDIPIFRISHVIFRKMDRHTFANDLLCDIRFRNRRDSRDTFHSPFEN